MKQHHLSYNIMFQNDTTLFTYKDVIYYYFTNYYYANFPIVLCTYKPLSLLPLTPITT